MEAAMIDIVTKNVKQIGTPTEEDRIYICDEAYRRIHTTSFDEKRVSPFMLQTTQYPSMNYGLGLNIQVASAQFDVIRKLADQGDCIFVGRCADYILRERKDLTRVFIMGDQEEKIRCIMNRQQISESEAKKKIKQVDKDRSSYYKYYTDQIWGESENYDLCINSSKIGITGTVNVIKAYIENNK